MLDVRRLASAPVPDAMTDAGYSIADAVLSEGECDALLAAIQHGNHHRGRAGMRSLMSNTVVSALASDSRLLRLAAAALGKQAVPFRATLFAKAGRANWLVAWHQDTALPLASRFDSPDWGPWSTKAGVLHALAPASALNRVVALRVQLDASTRDNGPLRVIPGSHVSGVLSDVEILALGRQADPIECLVGCGGVLTMRPLLIHSSARARLDLPRRVLHIEYADSLDLGGGARLAVA